MNSCRHTWSFDQQATEQRCICCGKSRRIQQAESTECKSIVDKPSGNIADMFAFIPRPANSDKLATISKMRVGSSISV